MLRERKSAASLYQARHARTSPVAFALPTGIGGSSAAGCREAKGLAVERPAGEPRTVLENWTKLLVGALVAFGAAACRTTSPAPVVEHAGETVTVPEAPAPTVEPSEPVAPTVEPFEIVLMARGGSSTNPVYDFTVRSDGTTTLRYLEYKKGTRNVFEQRASPEALLNLRDVLAASRLRREDGVYGGDAGSRSSARFHDSSRAIDLRTPTEHRRIKFPRPFASPQYPEDDQYVFLAFLDLWRATERCRPGADAPLWRW